MKGNIMINENKRKMLTKIIICFMFLLLALIGGTTVKAVNEQKGRLYLSDIPYMEKESSVASGHMIKLNKNDSDKLIELKVNNESKMFLKGITAWASSQVVYDLTGYNYDYFTSYVGVDIGEQSNYFNTGVRFYIYTSNDCKTWEKQVETGVLYGWSEAQLIHINIKGAKYLKLEASSNSKDWWAEWYDEAIYADAKLTKEGYVEDEKSTVSFIKTLDEYDKMIKQHEKEEIKGDYELTLLQRELVKRAGYDVLQAIARVDEDNKATLQWLMTNVDNLRLYVLGGEPDGNYVASLQALTNLYTKHKADLNVKERTEHGTVYGDLYKKMMITLSLTHSAQVSLWMDTTSPENQSDPVTRYEIYKKMHKEGKFKVSSTVDYTGLFEDLKVEEMRFVLNNIIDDEEIVWLNEYTQKQIDAHPNETGKYLTPHPYMKYIWPDYSRPEFHDPANKEKWNQKYDFLRYGVTYRAGVNKLWMNIEGGAVCGGISKIGSNIRGVHGIPSSVICQPGHAALIYYQKDAKGNGYWTIDNDVSGWAQSGKTERLNLRMPLGWGDDSYVQGYCATYIVLAQEALNDYATYEKASKIIMTADAYKNNPEKQEEIYKKALEVEPINIDAWYGLINLYKADETKTEKEYFELAKDLCESLKCFPLPMYQLSNLIKPMMKTNAYTFAFTVLQGNTLKEASTWQDATAVYQPAVTRTMANFLLGTIDKDLATFSFDGEDAGKIVLSSNYDDSGINWDYSLDGKETWTDVTFTASEEHKKELSEEEIEKITAENDIYIHIVGTNYEDENNIFKIDITSQENLSNLYRNDLENRVMGVSTSTEWRYTEEDEWTSYGKDSPKLKGDASVQVRQAATGTMMASSPVTFEFTEDNQPRTRKYIPIAQLSIENVSTEATGQGRYATNIIDGNYNTNWHSAWNGSDTEKYITIKIDRPIDLSAIEYVPAGGGNGKILEGQILGSTDGENFTQIGHVTWDNNENIKTVEFPEKPTVQYIKIIGTRTSSAGNGSFMTGRMLNFFQDITNNPYPTAGIEYSTTDKTTENVTAKLVNPSTDITITNNEGSDTYTFKENKEFTFEFYDNETKAKGTATARVDWIDREAPTARIEYNSGTGVDSEVIATLVPSEEIIVLNNEDGDKGLTYTFEENGEFIFKFKDLAGNTGEATAKVNWIGMENKLTTPGSSDSIQTESYKVEEGYISGIKPGTTVKEFKESVEIEEEHEIVFMDQYGTILTDENEISTDTLMKLSDNSQYILEVIGDIDGDGRITVNDFAKIKLHIIQKEELTKTKLKAADVDKNQSCSVNDMAQIKLMLIGLLEV